MVDPVNACLDEAEEIDEDERKFNAERAEVSDFLAGNVDFEDHDRDDDGDDAVREGFEPGGSEAVCFFLGHRLSVQRKAISGETTSERH
jgi:hypothetical protein